MISATLWINSGCFCALTPEKLENSVLFSSRRFPSNGPSSVVKLPREPPPFFRRSGNLGSSHSMVGPAMEGEHTAARLQVLGNSPATLLKPPGHPWVCSQPSIHPPTISCLVAFQMVILQPAALECNPTPFTIKVSGYSV